VNFEKDRNMKSGFIVTFCLFLLLASSFVQADRILIGQKGFQGQTTIFGKDEFDLVSNIPDNTWVLPDGMAGVTCMDKCIGIDGKFMVGTQNGYVFVRDIYDNSWYGANSYVNLTSTNNAILSICSRIDGHMLLGTDLNEYMALYRDYNDVHLNPPGVTGSACNAYASPVTAVAALPNGLTILGHENGWVLLRNPNDLNTTVTGVTTPSLSWGSKVNDMAVDMSTGNIVFALENGTTATRNWADLATPMTEVSWGAPVTEVESLTDGRVAIGYGSSNGNVSVRMVNDLATDLGSHLTRNFSGEYPIDALEVTSNNNILIAVARNYPLDYQSRVTITHGENLEILPVDFNNVGWTGWLITDFPCFAIAAVALPADVNCTERIAQGHGLVTDLNGDCYVNLADFTEFAELWQNCINPADANCAHPWE
jgi:hypothetical protein